MIEALEWTARLLGLGAVIHGLEFLILRRKIEAVWSWKDIEPELGIAFRPFLAPRSFEVVNILRVVTGVVMMWRPDPWGTGLLFLIHVLTLLRWLGTFNGGSDYMTLLLLWTCTLGLAIPDELAQVCVFYIVFQLCFSYFKAGWIKLKNPSWRTGTALAQFVASPLYSALALPGGITRTLSWTVILFEVTFPLCLLHHNIALAYMTAGFLFHLGNAYVFGLNRFVFAWLAAYPALYFMV